MIVKDKNGREIEISLYGSHDDLQIDEAYYLDSDDEVSEETINYIYDNYADAMLEEWVDIEIGRAEAYYESRGER